MTCRERFAGAALKPEGANAAVDKVFVAGTRRDAAADGGGRKGALVDGRGGGGIELKVVGLSEGGDFLVDELYGVGKRLLDESPVTRNEALIIGDCVRSATGRGSSSGSTMPIDIVGDFSM